MVKKAKKKKATAKKEKKKSIRPHKVRKIK